MAPLSVEGGDILQLISVLPKARRLFSFAVPIAVPIKGPVRRLVRCDQGHRYNLNGHVSSSMTL